MSRKTLFFVVLAAVCLAVTATVTFADRVGPRVNGEFVDLSAIRPGDLPEINREGSMTVTPKAADGRSLSVLQLDDGGCEGEFTWAMYAFNEFDVPPQCIQSGLQIVGVTAHVANAITVAQSPFTLRQGGADPGALGTGSPRPISMAGNSLCAGNTTAMASAALPSPATVTGTSNFFAGLVVQPNQVAFDNNTANGMRAWAQEYFGGGTYNPAAMHAYFGMGAWMIRVTVEDTDCVPVELMSFSIE